MRSNRNPAFDHGAALRVPPAHDKQNERNLLMWLGGDGRRLSQPGAVEVSTPDGLVTALPGDWIVLSVSGAFHVARGGPRAA